MTKRQAKVQSKKSGPQLLDMLPESPFPPPAQAPARGGRSILVPAIRPIRDDGAAREKEGESDGERPINDEEASREKTGAKNKSGRTPALPAFSGEKALKSRGTHQMSGYEKPAPLSSLPYGIEAQYNKSEAQHPKSRAGKHPAASGAGKFISSPSHSESSAAPITRKTGILEIMEKYPEMLEMLMATGLHCVGCQLSVFDDLETGFRLHGYDEDVIDSFIAKMNEAVVKKQTEEKDENKEKKNRK